MRKDALIEMVQSSLMQLDKTSKYHDKLVESYISMASNMVLGKLFLRDMSNYDLYAKEYTGVTVSQDATTERYYSEYPAPIVQTIDVAKGVRSINTTTGTGLQFAPVRKGEISIFEDLDIATVIDVIPYIPEQGRILYIGTPVDYLGNVITSVRMSLVVPFTEYDNDEHFYIPGGSDIELINTVIELMGRIPPKDLLNNESDRLNIQRNDQ